jgi:hypothetical protein
MAEGELDAAFEARLWDFIAAVRDKTSHDRPDLLPIAQWLAISWRLTVIELYVQTRRLTRDQAEAFVDEIIDDHRALCGSMAEMLDLPETTSADGEPNQET